MQNASFLWLSAADVRRLLRMEEAIALMKEAFIQLSAGEACVPVRTGIDLAAHRGKALFMPVYLPRSRQAGLKVVSVHEDNPEKGLPAVQAVVAVLDAATGQLEALMDGDVLTAVRTGAASGLATDLLARRGAAVAAVIGAGTQARTQLEAVCMVRPIRRAYVFCRAPAHAHRFADEMRDRLAVEVIPADGAERLREADVICTATTAATPVFDAAHVRPGAHINAVGAYRPDMAEIPAETVRRARVVVDDVAACLAEAGDLIQPIRAGLIGEGHLYAELGEVAAGRKGGRVSEEEVTLFKSVGNAVQDLAVAGRVLALARAQGLGTRLAR